MELILVKRFPEYNLDITYSIKGKYYQVSDYKTKEIIKTIINDKEAFKSLLKHYQTDTPQKKMYEAMLGTGHRDQDFGIKIIKEILEKWDEK